MIIKNISENIFHKNIVKIILLSLSLFDLSFCQQSKPENYLQKPSQSRFYANDITDIVVHQNTIWFGSSKGLISTSNDGLNFSSYANTSGIGEGHIAAVNVNKDGVIWISTVFDSTTSVGNMDVGGGLSYSTDSGANWHWIPQPVDAVSDTDGGKKPTTVAVSNITWDIAFRDDEVWIGSWAGGLRKSTDSGKTWEVVTPDGLPFDVLGNLNHRVFSVINAQNGLWVGTAAGINKSTDGGKTWTLYNAQNGSGISGNFVNGLAEQIYQGRSIIWASTWKAEGEDEYYGVSKTENGGLTWETFLEGEKPHAFAFYENEVFIAADNGLFKSVDFGKSWALFPQITDEYGSSIMTTETYSIAVKGSDVWVGTGDGLAKTSDRGNTWKIFRAFKSTAEEGEPATYAYPNPFSPMRHNVINGEGHVRIQYNTTSETTVSIKIFDFGMNLVKDLVSDKPRPSSGDYYELWDGRNENGIYVANGVYFYKLELSGEKTAWGKIVVIN